MVTSPRSLADKSADSGTTETFLERRIPRNMVNFRTYYNVNDKLKFDNFLYYVDNVVVNSSYSAPAYVRYDSRIAYALEDNLSVALVGQNLSDPKHIEWGASLYSNQREIGRTVLFELKYDF